MASRETRATAQTPGRRWWRRRDVVAGAVVAALLLIAAVAILPTTTRQGINYKVGVYRIPAYVKTLDFLQRHHQYQLMVSRVCDGTPSARDCVMALFDWTHANVRQQPQGFPVVDDHPLNIAIRGYGTGDQMADLFSILATYADIPAFFRFLPASDTRDVLSLAFARLDGRWIPFDVEHHAVFRHPDGHLASIDELLANPALLDAHDAALPGDLRYSTFISPRHLDPFVVPSTLRGDLQRPFARLRYEMRRLVGLERE